MINVCHERFWKPVAYDLQQWLRYDLIILEQCASTVSQQYKRES